MRSNNLVLKDYFKIHYLVLQLLGVPLDPIENSMAGFLYRIYATFIFATLYIYFLLSEIASLMYDQDVEMATFSLTYILTQSLGILKIILILSIRKKVKAFCRSLESEPFSPDANRSGDVEFLFIKRAITSSNAQKNIFCFIATVIITQVTYYAVSSPTRERSFTNPTTNTTLVKHTRLLPFNCKVFFETNNSPYYEVVVAYGAFSALFLGYDIGTIDALICGMLCHIKAQLLILKECLKTYVQRGIYLMKEDNPNLDQRVVGMLQHISDDLLNIQEIPLILQKYVHVAVREITVHHQKVIKFSHDFDETFSLLMLAQFLFSVGILCFQLFQLSIIPIRSIYFLSMVFYTGLMLFQIYLYCYFGNEIIYHSHELVNAVFESCWYLTSPRTRKLLLIMMIGAGRPIRMTAGKFVFLSLESFMSIIRGAGSYFTVLKNTKGSASKE